eukprot:CAMPEP_0184491336 /NCGR_PEP_ID=MMETSP0113_2-20130426/20166_1 /TAXON_ID=91329 /ORGANISM="Norrisiella sphaerica, Strain BC52" /LENGTH=574 /DNA_ID=CAMNT_0026875659 /DNA_START=148 /DNA_END=1872 /DNA_ORIENTATION=+
MHTSASQPALNTLGVRRGMRGHRDAKGSMRPVRSENDIKEIRNPMKNILRRIPFYAIHGMSANVRAISRTVSRDSLASGDISEAGTHETDLLLPEVIAQQGCTPILAAAVLSSLMGAINFGYNTSVLNTPEFAIRTNLDDSYVDDFSWAMIVSIFCMGGLIGSSLAPPILDTIGRKKFMLYSGIFLTICLLFEACSMSVMMMVIARFGIGINCGGSTVAVPLYLGEIAPISLRGSLGTLNQFAMVVGILLANVLGKPLGTDPEWRYLLGIGAIFSTLQVVLGVCVVESPRWLVINGQVQEAEKILRQLRGSGEDSKFLEIELESMLDLVEEEKQEVSVSSLVRKPALRFPFLVGVSLQLFQQWSGINAVFYYSTGFFENAQFADPYLGTVLAGAVNVLATGFAVELMDRAGRKPLLLLSCLGMTISSCLLTASLIVSSYFNVELGYIEVMGVLSYVAFFEFGLGPIPWAITAELFGPVERATAMGACSAVNWIGNFIVGLTFPTMNGALGSYTFLPFAAVTLVATLFSVYYVPETKGKTLAEIRESMFNQMKPTKDSPITYEAVSVTVDGEDVF